MRAGGVTGRGMAAAAADGAAAGMIVPEQEDSITPAAIIAMALAFNAHPDRRFRSYRTFTNLLPVAPASVTCTLPSRDYAIFCGE